VPTVKLSGGKVVTKEGKVSCTCCTPSACCMYPADHDWGDGSDLPAAITLLGVGSLSKSGTDYGDTTNGVILESGVWARYVGGVRTTRPCLIDGDGNLTPGNDKVEDQFAGTYTGENGLGQSYVYTRVGECEWSGTLPFLRTPCSLIWSKAVCKWRTTCGGGGGYKAGNQTSPVGFYASANPYYRVTVT